MPAAAAALWLLLVALSGNESKGHVGQPDDVTQMVLFLADEHRSGFITGQQFVVDGGTTKKMYYPE